MAEQDSMPQKPHLLHLILENEGAISGKLICPHDPPTRDMSCVTVERTGEPTDPPVCFVCEWFGQLGMEVFEGEVKLAPIAVDWEVTGWGEDTEFWLHPHHAGNAR